MQQGWPVENGRDDVPLLRRDVQFEEFQVELEDKVWETATV
jgi:hypothetical protein